LPIFSWGVSGPALLRLGENAIAGALSTFPLAVTEVSVYSAEIGHHVSLCISPVVCSHKIAVEKIVDGTSAGVRYLMSR
jgi:hypothetical protein